MRTFVVIAQSLLNEKNVFCSNGILQLSVDIWAPWFGTPLVTSWNESTTSEWNRWRLELAESKINFLNWKMIWKASLNNILKDETCSKTLMSLSDSLFYDAANPSSAAADSKQRRKRFERMMQSTRFRPFSMNFLNIFFVAKLDLNTI